MRILISGGAGFLASHLTDLLLEQGHEVVGVDNFITGKADNIRHLEGNPRHKFIRHDVIEPLKIDGTIDQELGKLLLAGEPPAQPVGHDAGAEPCGPNFLTHVSLFPAKGR